MEEELQNKIAREGLDMKVEHRDEMEVDSNEGDIVFAREGPMDVEGSGVCKTGFHTVSDTEKKEVAAKEDTHSGENSTEVNRLFKQALISLDWELAESMISEANPPTLNDFLCFLLSYVWCLWTEPALDMAEELIEMIVSEGACDIKKAVISSSRLASFFLGCQCVSPDEMVTFMDKSVLMLSDLALNITDFHPLLHGNTDGEKHSAKVHTILRLGAFETFLELAGDNLNGEDFTIFTEAFDAACSQLTRFSSSFYPGWSCGEAGSVIPDFLGKFVALGATASIVGQCVLLAACHGSTELVEILLEIAHDNEVHVDVDEALDAACYFENIDTMNYLIEECNATALGPFLWAAERGSLPVVQWFIKRGFKASEIIVALICATSSSQLEVVAYLLPLIPQRPLYVMGADILVNVGKKKGSVEGVDFLLRSDFMGNPTGTYRVADLIATSEDGVVVPELRSFLLENWSEKAYYEGIDQGVKHFVYTMMVIRKGESPLLLRNLPVALRVAISYLSVYKECVGGGGRLLSQRARGQLMVAVWRLENVMLHQKNQSKELMDVMERHLGSFL